MDDKVHFFEHMSVYIMGGSMRDAISYFLNILFEWEGWMVGLRYWADEMALFVEIGI